MNGEGEGSWKWKAGRERRMRGDMREREGEIEGKYIYKK